MSIEEVALSFLMILTLRSRRYPLGQARKTIVDGSGYVADLNRENNTFTIVLRPRSGAILQDIATCLNLALSPVEYDFAEEVWIDQMILPDQLEKQLGGPALGIEGLRDRFFSRARDRPLLGFTISSADSSWISTLDHIKGAVRGGVDFLADDMLDPAGNDVHTCCKRVDTVFGILNACSRPDVPYFVNVSSYSLMASEVVEALTARKVAGFVINPQVVGWDHTAWFRRCVGDRAAVFHTNMGSGFGSRYAKRDGQSYMPTTGLAEGVTSYLSRLTGADAVHAGTAGTACYDKDWRRPIEVLTEPQDGIRDCFRIAEGDVTPNNVFANLKALGRDLLIEANSAIYGHPAGAEAGAKSFREMIDLLPNEWFESETEVLELVLSKASVNLKKALQTFKDKE